MSEVSEIISTQRLNTDSPKAGVGSDKVKIVRNMKSTWQQSSSSAETHSQCRFFQRVIILRLTVAYCVIGMKCNVVRNETGSLS